MDITTKLSIAYRMYVNKLPVEGVAIACNIDRSTVYRWYKKFKYLGFKRTVKYYLGIRRKKRLRKLDPLIKQKIYELREKHHKCCGQKIKYYLQRDHGIRLSLETVYKVLRQKYTLRNKYKEYKYGEAPKGHKPREVVQTDTVDFGDLFAFTFVDTYTREAFVTLKESLESQSGKESLEEASKRFGWIELLQNDGGPEFKGYFLEVVNNYANKHRISRPYKKNEQSFIESFNRSLRKECLGWRKYRKEEIEHARQKLEDYLYYYNNERAHLSLKMMTPNEFKNSLSHI